MPSTAPSPAPSAPSKPRRPPTTPRPPEPATLHRLYTDEALTVAAVATHLGVATGTAHKWLLAAGVPMRPPVTTPRVAVDDDDIRRLYISAGHTAAEIADHLGCPTTTVYDRLQRLGVPRRPAEPRQRRRPADDELRRLYGDEGLSLRQLAERFSVTPQAVRNGLVAASIPRRSSAAPQHEPDLPTLIDLYTEGWTGTQLARRFNCSKATIYRRLDRAGVPRRRDRRAVGRPELLDAIDAGLSATEMAARFDVSVSTVCRRLAREGLETPAQAARRQARERYTAQLEVAEQSGTADAATTAWLRRRVDPRPSP
jgi:transposase/transposase-like protein